MQTIDQQRAAALVRINANRKAAAEKSMHAARINGMKRTGQIQTLIVKSGRPMVRAGGNSLHDLREDVYDAANNTNGRAGLVQDIDATYDSAMMGGEPYAVWN